METTDDIDQIYQKFLIQIHLNETTYWVVWGTDLSGPESQDRLLLDDQQRILLFAKSQPIVDFITRPAVPLFDADNLTKWAKSQTDFKVSAFYDLDYMTMLLNSNLSQEQILYNPDITHELINFLNLFSDYVYPLEDDSLIAIRRTRQATLFFDYCYDTYFWATPKEDLRRRQASYLKKFRFGKFRSDMKRMLALFADRCIVVS